MRSVYRALFLPSPVLTGSGSTGVISAPKGTPVSPGYHRKMALGTALWDDLLEGEELAHLTTIPPADPRTASLPDELHLGLREALPFDSLYAHQREAWDAAKRGEHLILATGSTSACCRTTTAGPTSCTISATSSSTRRMSTAASSAHMSAASCGDCGGSPASTVPNRSSCSPRRRSPTPPRSLPPYRDSTPRS